MASVGTLEPPASMVLTHLAQVARLAADNQDMRIAKLLERVLMTNVMPFFLS